MAGAVLLLVGKKVFQVIKSSQQPTSPISTVDDVRSTNWLKKPNQSEKTTLNVRRPQKNSVNESGCSSS
uniref:Uncharacterized protein n=1 Tax=uncultured marine microorganism HF4000_010I05 TaxID=455517 RepID=B3T1J2_9ZZZZ|nr:hypothetical protein ALOHA_HF4000010I05ctg1g15 [uncultured marine microorganism HF4000_010I05]